MLRHLHSRYAERLRAINAGMTRTVRRPPPRHAALVDVALRASLGTLLGLFEDACATSPARCLQLLGEVSALIEAYGAAALGGDGGEPPAMALASHLLDRLSAVLVRVGCTDTYTGELRVCAAETLVNLALARQSVSDCLRAVHLLLHYVPNSEIHVSA